MMERCCMAVYTERWKPWTEATGKGLCVVALYCNVVYTERRKPWTEAADDVVHSGCESYPLRHHPSLRNLISPVFRRQLLCIFRTWQYSVAGHARSPLPRFCRFPDRCHSVRLGSIRHGPSFRSFHRLAAHSVSVTFHRVFLRAFPTLYLYLLTAFWMMLP